MKEHLSLLGLKVRDAVTGFKGIVTTIGFDLYGCVQAIVSPLAKKDESPDGRWFDTKRLIVEDQKPVMTVPTFESVPGGQSKPGFPRTPIK